MSVLLLLFVVAVAVGLAILLAGVRQPFPVTIGKAEFLRSRQGRFSDAQGFPVRDPIMVKLLEDEFQDIMAHRRSHLTTGAPK